VTRSWQSDEHHQPSSKSQPKIRQRSARHFFLPNMGVSESTENRRSYQNCTHAEFRGGVFHGAITIVAGGLVPEIR